MPNKSLNTISQQVESFIQRHHLVHPGQHVLVAVSGGADSVAMLHLLKEMAPSFKLRLTVAHLNHKIRGRAAEEDAQFVKQLARRLRFDFVLGVAAVPWLARRSGVSLEMAGRKARYNFFEKAAKKHNCNVVATAHTADDNAETILLMLLRGCGLPGLTGIAPAGKIGKITVIRPLLGIDRPTIEKYLRARNIVWREDVTNTDPDFLRNRVRHELLPLLEAKYNKGIRTALLRLADVLKGENELLDALAAAIYAEARDISKPALNCVIMVKYPPALRRRVLRHWLKINGVNPEKIDYQAINSIDGLFVKTGRSRAVNLADGIIVRRSYQRLEIEAQKTEPIGKYCHKIKIPGRTILPETGLMVRAELGPGVCRARAVFGKFPVRASLSLKKLGQKRISVRPWRPGDRMRPYGLDGSKKVQDIFSDAKAPVALRRQLPIFECGGEIVWIPGYRIAAGWEVKDTTRAALQLTVAPN